MSVLELERVVKHYHAAGEEVRAVDGVSLTLDAGTMLALHGPSGSGKTTLLLLIAALVRADAGSIRYRGRELSRLSEREASEYLRREVGFVHQGLQLMPRVSALENAALKLLLDGVSPRKARAVAQPWLERVGLSDRIDHAPEQLSGGERQRVAIARALAGEPKLVLADEPTANLDSQRSMETVALLRQIAHEGRSVILVTHDAEAAALADQLCHLRDGRLVEGEPSAARPPDAGSANGPGMDDSAARGARSADERGTETKALAGGHTNRHGMDTEALA